MALKKNVNKGYISDTQEDTPWWRRTLRNSAFALSITIIGFLGTVFNTYLTSRIAPLAYRIDSIQKKVDAQSSTLQVLATLPITQNDVENIEKRLDNIEMKIDDITSYLIQAR